MVSIWGDPTMQMYGNFWRISLTSWWFQAFFPNSRMLGVFAQYRFRCVLGELGRFREGTGFREPVPGTSSGNRIWVSMGSDRFCGFKVPVQKVCVPEVSKVSLFDGLGPVPEVLTELFLGTGFQELEVLRSFRAKVSDSYSVLRKYTLVL